MSSWITGYLINNVAFNQIDFSWRHFITPSYLVNQDVQVLKKLYLVTKTSQIINICMCVHMYMRTLWTDKSFGLSVQHVKLSPPEKLGYAILAAEE